MTTTRTWIPTGENVTIHTNQDDTAPVTGHLIQHDNCDAQVHDRRKAHPFAAVCTRTVTTQYDARPHTRVLAAAGYTMIVPTDTLA